MSTVKNPDPVAWLIEHPHPLFRAECTIDKLVADHWKQITDAEVTPLFSEAYVNKRVREALEQAYAKLDEIGAQLQQTREDRNDDYWSGIGAMVEAAEEAIRALIPI